MPVYIYDKSGLIEERPESQSKQAGKEIHEHNKIHQESIRRLLVAPTFPPPEHIFDPEIGDIRPKSISDRINAGEVALQPGDQIVAHATGDILVPAGFKVNAMGLVAPKTIEEKIADGLIPFDPVLQKVDGDRVLPKSRQELLDQGSITIADLLNQSLQRLRAQTDVYLATKVTPNGYRLDNLARQKAALTMQYRQLPETDPVKADLLQRKVIYTDAIVDEILNEIERVQSAYDQAKNALQSIANQNQPVSVFDSVKLEDYLAAP